MEQCVSPGLNPPVSEGLTRLHIWMDYDKTVYTAPPDYGGLWWFDIFIHCLVLRLFLFAASLLGYICFGCRLFLRIRHLFVVVVRFHFQHDQFLHTDASDWLDRSVDPFLYAGISASVFCAQ